MSDLKEHKATNKLKPATRLVVFMTGYDVAGPERYHLMLRQQHRYYARRFDVSLKLSKLIRNEKPKSHFSKCSLQASWPNGDTETTFMISDWQEEAQRDAARSFWYRTPRYLYWYTLSWVKGVSPAIFKRQPRAGVVLSLPFLGVLTRLLIFFGFIGLSLLAAKSFGISTNALSFIGATSGILGFYLVFRFHQYMKTIYEPHLADSFMFQCRITDGASGEVEKQAAQFSKELTNHINDTKPDEVLLIGHSCGCFHSLPMHKALLDEAKRDNAHQYNLIHTTFGSLLPYTTLYKKNELYRQLSSDLLNDPKTDWIEFFAPQDPFSVPYIAQDKDYGLDLIHPRPSRYEVRSAKFGEIFSQKKLRQFKYNPLRMHFQYLAANDVLGDFDFFKMLTHPNSFKNRLRCDA